MRHAVFDLETNGYLEATDRIHCLSIRDMDSDDLLSCTDASDDYPSIEEGLEVLANADRIYAHNLFGFDLPVLRKLHPEWETDAQYLDTLPMVRARYAHQKDYDYDLQRQGRLPGGLIGSHKLEAWGYRLGILKDDYQEWCERQGIEEPFAEWRVEMQDYCDQDTLALKALIVRLRQAGAMPPETIKTEMFMGRYLSQQERNGWPFDFESAVKLQANLSAKREELGDKLRDHFGTWCEPKRLSKEDWKRIDTPKKLKWAAKEGYAFVPKVNNSRYGYVEGVPCVKLKWIEFNPASRMQIANRLQHYGWEPKERTKTGRPKVSEDVLGGLDMPFTDDLVDYLTVDKRLGQLAEGNMGWLKQIEDDRTEGGAITGLFHIHHASGATTITHRPRHSRPNLGQVPSLHKPYGVECRELFTVPKGWKLLGVDVDGLELRLLAHYLYQYDDGEYAEAVLQGSKEDGTDVHSRAANIIGLDRPGGKTFNYAYLYGAGDEKLGSIVKPHAPSDIQSSLGAELRAQFESGFTGLGSLQTKLKSWCRRHDYLVGPDGRRIYVRSLHSVLNTLLQGAGAIACRWWIRFAGEKLEEELGAQGWNGDWAALAWVHDETQSAVRGRALEIAPDIWTQAITDAGEALDIRLPLTGSSDLGDTWAETH